MIKESVNSNVVGSKADIDGARVRVYGKAQNRTALGIMHAYMVMYPQAKLEDLQKAFPDSLNPDSGVKKNFVYAEDKGTTADWNGFFKKEEELLAMGDGRKVSVVSMWTKPSFERLVAWAKQYGIVVADFEASKGGGEKGGYRLEYLNGYVPPKPKSNDASASREKTTRKHNGYAFPKLKLKVPAWIWAIVALIILILLALLLLCRKGKERVVTETVVVHDTLYVKQHDTLYVKQIAEIEKNFNAAQFAPGKSDLGDDAKFVLHDLASVMRQNPELRLKLEGHTSAEGNPKQNQRLSEARANAAVTFLVEKEGIEASRLEAVGKGSSEPKNTADPMAPENRRTEFLILE